MSIKRVLQNTACLSLVLVQIAFFPSISFAQEAASEPTTQETTSSETASGSSSEPAPDPQPQQQQQGASNTGPTTPTGSDSKTYVQQEDGSWSNGTYSWDPNTKQTKPLTPQEYSYNPTTGRWDTTEWVYHPETGKYEPNVVSVDSNPNAAAKSGGAAGAAALGIGNTGPNSNNEIDLNSDTNGFFDLFFNGAISNKINSNAKSGDALVQGNSKAGSALTGDAAALANILNMLQSSWLGQSSDIATFITNLDGDLYGDLIIDPNNLPYNSLGVSNADIDINLTANAAIDNDIDLVATSGNAKVDGNTEAGNATSGNAKAMANVINMINSAIKAGKSFLGMVNINGNYDGDILLPPGVLEALIANTGPNSNNTIGGSTNADVDVTSNATKTVNNNVTTDASSGNANVDSNTQAGSAKTGTADTSIQSMNVVGQNVKGKNGLLVFVNVLGKWVGLVVGPSSAHVVNTGPGSNNSINGGTSSQSVSVDSEENSLINNDISVAAHSGDATVSNNTKAGNATSGNAQASVNLLNIIGSEIDVTDWFGVLFINVFGSWAGNFGSDTAHGGYSQNPNPNGGTGGSGVQSPAASGGSGQSNNGNVFGFVSRSLNNFQGTNNQQAAQPLTEDQSNGNFAIFGSTTNGTPTDFAATPSSGASVGGGQMNWWVLTGIVGMIATLIVLVREYVVALRAERLA